jgi:hypothetical protein
MRPYERKIMPRAIKMLGNLDTIISQIDYPTPEVDLDRFVARDTDYLLVDLPWDVSSYGWMIVNETYLLENYVYDQNKINTEFVTIKQVKND